MDTDSPLGRLGGIQTRRQAGTLAIVTDNLASRQARPRPDVACSPCLRPHAARQFRIDRIARRPSHERHDARVLLEGGAPLNRTLPCRTAPVNAPSTTRLAAVLVAALPPLTPVFPLSFSFSCPCEKLHSLALFTRAFRRRSAIDDASYVEVHVSECSKVLAAQWRNPECT